MISSHGAAVNGSVQLSQRTTVSGDYALSFQPLSASSLFRSLSGGWRSPLPTAYDLRSRRENYLSDSGSAQVSHSLTKRTGLTFGYTYSHSKATAQQYGQRSAGISGGVSHALGKGLGLRLGYGRRIGRSRQRRSWRRGHRASAHDRCRSGFQSGPVVLAAHHAVVLDRVRCVLGRS